MGAPLVTVMEELYGLPVLSPERLEPYVLVELELSDPWNGPELPVFVETGT